MVQTTLFLTPVARDEAYRHFRYSVLDNEQPVWGISEGVKSQWEKVRPKDILLFYTGNFEYEFGAKVQKTVNDYELSKELYEEYDGNTGAQETEGGGGPWPYLIYLSNPFNLDLSSRELHEYADYGNDYPMKFHSLNSLGHRKIRQEFGSVEEYIEQNRA